MNYLLKEDASKELIEKYKNKYIADKMGISVPYASLILHRHRPVKKRIAYAFCKVINSEYEIEDLFEIVK